MSESTRKYYTFLNITDGPDGVKNCTAALTLTKPDLRELSDDKRVLTCPAAFTNRTKVLSDALGCEIKGQDDTVWCDVQFWNDRADRFQKFLNGRDKVRLIVCGRLSVRKWTAKDGSAAQRVQISVNDWYNLPTSAAAPAEAPAASASEPASNVETCTDEDLPF